MEALPEEKRPDSRPLTPAPPPVVGGGAVFLVQGEIPCLPAGRYFALQGCGDYFTSSIFLRLVKALAPSMVLASMR
jgi:hypothetical protein